MLPGHCGVIRCETAVRQLWILMCADHSRAILRVFGVLDRRA